MTELWSWRIDGAPPVGCTRRWPEALGRVVMPLAVADPARLPTYAVICDVWEAPGCSAPWWTTRGAREPGTELPCASPRWPGCSAATACCATTPSTPAGTCLVAPDGTIRPVHFDVRETDDGEVLSGQRLCTVAHPGCRGWSRCHRSRWAPGLGLPGPRRGLTVGAGRPEPRGAKPAAPARPRCGPAPARPVPQLAPAGAGQRPLGAALPGRRAPRAGPSKRRGGLGDGGLTAASNAAALCAAGAPERRSSGRTATPPPRCRPGSPPARTAHAGS